MVLKSCKDFVSMTEFFFEIWQKDKFCARNRTSGAKFNATEVRKKFEKESYQARNPRSTPAATAEPITPATLGPIACMRR